MHPQRGMVRQANVRLGLLLMLVVLALSACGGGSSEQQAEARHLLKDEKPLPAGEYHTGVQALSFLQARQGVD